MAAELESFLGRPIALVIKPIWPEETLPGIIERWMDREKPDIVWLNVAAYWMSYESSPKRVRRWFGRAGDRAAALGERAGQSTWLAERRTYRGLRKLTQAMIGGDPCISTDGVIERVTRCARVILRGERCPAANRGAAWAEQLLRHQAAARRGEARPLAGTPGTPFARRRAHCGYSAQMSQCSIPRHPQLPRTLSTWMTAPRHQRGDGLPGPPRCGHRVRQKMVRYESC